MNRSSSKPSVVVIGSGIGGLACGAYLARQGLDVTILERHKKPGGYATSFKRGSFTFEVSLHALSVSDNATGMILRDLGVTKDVEFVSHPDLHRVVTPGLDITLPQRDPRSLARVLAERFPADTAGIHALVDDLVGVATEVDDLAHKDDRFFLPLFPFTYPKM